LIVISHITKDSNLIQKLRTQRILGELIRQGQEAGELAEPEEHLEGQSNMRMVPDNELIHFIRHWHHS
jgi:hypothetical protein